MKRISFLTLFLVLGVTPYAMAEVCYQLSKDGVSWSRTAELLCVDVKEDGAASLKLLINAIGGRKQVASFDLSLLRRARTFHVNQDVYGLANPENSIFNELKIVFDGKGNVVPSGPSSSQYYEEGTVAIGKNVFHYRSHY